MTRRLVAKTGGDFLEDVAQRRRRPHCGRHGKRQAMSLGRAAILAVIRILTEYHHLHFVRTGETQCAEDVGGIDGLARSAFTIDEAAERCIRVAFNETLQMPAPCGRQGIELGFE